MILATCLLALIAIIMVERFYPKFQTKKSMTMKKGFRQCRSRPIFRQAYQLQESDVLTPVSENTLAVGIGGCVVEFKHHEPVVAGDYVVHLTEKDTYHCSKAEFEERNEV
jgi:hypothetical protein